MHILFSGAGAGISPLALIAKQAGYQVSVTDKQDNEYVHYLRVRGIKVTVGQTAENLKKLHQSSPIDWYVYSSALEKENPNHPELEAAKNQGIKTTKRDDFINVFMTNHDLKMIAIAGTHGKTTTTAMTIWLLKQLNVPISYSVGAKMSFGEPGEYVEGSEYFVYEADEYDRNFLAFHPFASIIAGIAWDHPDIYPTQTEYNQAFKDFINQSSQVFAHPKDLKQIGLGGERESVDVNQFKLVGKVNRENAQLVVEAIATLTDTPVNELIGHMNRFPGVSRRFEKIAQNVYSDYAHTPAKIRGALQLAHEMLHDQEARVLSSDEVQGSGKEQSEPYMQYGERVPEPVTQQFAENAGGVNGPDIEQASTAQKPGVVVVYEGLHNTRQHFIKEDLRHLFDGVKKLYVVPSYLAREDETLEMLTPQKLISLTSKPEKAEAKQLDDDLKQTIISHQEAGDLVLCLTAGGGGSLDEWLRQNF